MFRSTTSLVLLVAFAIQTFYTGGVVADYYLNTAQYLKDCINKAKPVLKCNGKCQMSKKIQEEQKREEQAPERKSEYKFNLLCVRADFAKVTIAFSSPPETFTLRGCMKVATGHLHQVFQPPSLV